MGTAPLHFQLNPFNWVRQAPAWHQLTIQNPPLPYCPRRLASLVGMGTASLHILLNPFNWVRQAPAWHQLQQKLPHPLPPAVAAATRC
ncbi:hypothetical protein LNTAR_02202 [Lentisphaera araneosa HTCC2155]|uniref:Uncharacterized protein n=1 Tax=Lentisphaera araneosa HTCC2155 TaxID=313628 RepID=A6DP50_9BACT|nr:hypothetical protein [Lentisphaera araneosa]EDM26582.1 hypothetical protein LNTAR_02202 [Lentisphaera araneosa HTCC2155]